MNKEVAVYTSFSQVMVHQKFAVFYPSKLVPDLLEHYVIVCGKSVYRFLFKAHSMRIY